MWCGSLMHSFMHCKRIKELVVEKGHLLMVSLELYYLYLMSEVEKGHLLMVSLEWMMYIFDET